MQNTTSKPVLNRAIVVPFAQALLSHLVGDVGRAAYAPLPAERLSPLFGLHTRPKTALAVPLDPALTMVFHTNSFLTKLFFPGIIPTSRPGCNTCV